MTALPRCISARRPADEATKALEKYWIKIPLECGGVGEVEEKSGEDDGEGG